MCQNFPALHCILYRGLLKSKVSYVKEKAKKNLHILHTSNKNMNVLLKEEKWLLLKGNKSKYDWAKTNKEKKSKSAEGVRGQSTD